MKKPMITILFLALLLGAKSMDAQQADVFPKEYTKVTKFLPAAVNNKPTQEMLVFYRMGWNSKAPASIAIQFANLGYTDWKLKFAVKDVVTKKTVLLDKEHNSTFGTELLKGNTKSTIWVAPVDNIKDGYSVRVWIGEGDEIDLATVSIKDKDSK